MHELRRNLDEYWAWLASKPSWRGMALHDIKNNYVDVVYADAQYDQLFIHILEDANAIIEEVNESHFLSNECTQLLLEAILVDYLWEGIIDACTSSLEATVRQQLLVSGIKHWSYHVRCLCVEKIALFPFERLEVLLSQVITEDINNDVKRFALLSLSKIDIERAVAFSINFIHSLNKNEYIIISSIDILSSYNLDLLRPYADALRHFDSIYVKERIETLFQ